MVYHLSMRTRLTSVLFIAVGIFGLHYESLPAVYAQSRPNAEAWPVISITRQGSLYLDEQPVAITVLVNELRRRYPMASEVYLRADRNTVWDAVSRVLAALEAAKPPIQVRVTQPT
jgi:biopolymer transport protein ExbD